MTYNGTLNEAQRAEYARINGLLNDQLRANAAMAAARLNQQAGAQAQPTAEQLQARFNAQQNTSPGINRDASAFWRSSSAPPRSRFDSPDVIDLVADSDGVFRVPVQLEHRVRER